MEWKDYTPVERGRVLHQIAKILEKDSVDIIDAIIKDTGKNKQQAEGEMRSAIDMCYYMAGEGRRLYGQTTTSELSNRWAMTKRYHIGHVGVIIPWNFPVSLLSWRVFPALICGNTVNLKYSSRTPNSAAMVASRIQCRLPTGTLKYTSNIKDFWNDTDMKMVSFTGSTETGRKIAERCGNRLMKCSLELGGKNAVIILEDADLELAVKAVSDGAFSFNGQRCTSTSRVIVHKEIYHKFLDLLREETKKYEDARIITDDNSLFSEYWGAELFKPILCIVSCPNLDAAIEIHNASPYGLSGSIFTKDFNKALKAVDEMEAGVIYVNGPTYGSEVHLPFGGMKDSGNGHREVGNAIEMYSELKTIYLDYSGVLQNAQRKQ